MDTNESVNGVMDPLLARPAQNGATEHPYKELKQIDAKDHESNGSYNNNNNNDGSAASRKDSNNSGTSTPPDAVRSDSSQSSSKSSGDFNSRVKTGIVGETRFVVPETKSMFDALMKPNNWGIAEVLVNLIMLYNVMTLLMVRVLPLWIYVVHFAFWRLSYNLTLGLILRRQSNTNFITEWVRNFSPESQVLAKRLVKSSMGTDYSWSKMPVEFNAWILFRMFAMMILANDGLTYVILCIKLFQPLDQNPLVLLLCLVGSVGLIAFSFWSKTSAHRCVGDYAWYWGDFFFRMEGDLVFDGVFEMFPHPMYTVGYAAYYGFSLLCRSSTLLIISLLAHLAQILFLVYIEEPHIQKIYGPSQSDIDQMNKARQRESRVHAKEPLGLKYLDIFRPMDFSLVYSVVLNFIIGVFVDLGMGFYTTHLIFWRLLHFGGLSLILHVQSTRNWWMDRFRKRGYSEAESFALWKRLYNFSVVMNHASFLIFSYRVTAPKLAHVTKEDLFSASSVATTISGFVLIWISIYIVTSAAEALGHISWFYGDFFLPKDTSEPQYVGIYRYMNNPDCVLGFLGHYGLALVLRSWRVFWVALLSNLANYLFVHFVEVPHMERNYSNLRDAAALERVLREQVERVPIVRQVSGKLRLEATKSTTVLRQKTKEQALQVQDKLEKLRADIVDDISRLRNHVAQHRIMLRTSVLKDQAANRMQRMDSELLNLLKRSTMTREYLEECLSDDEALPESPSHQNSLDHRTSNGIDHGTNNVKSD